MRATKKTPYSYLMNTTDLDSFNYLTSSMSAEQLEIHIKAIKQEISLLRAKERLINDLLSKKYINVV